MYSVVDKTIHRLHACDEMECTTCGGALTICMVCGGADIALTSECPGRPLLLTELALVCDGALDFKDGRWISTQRSL
jgi:hypothetical protein